MYPPPSLSPFQGHQDIRQGATGHSSTAVSLETSPSSRDQILHRCTLHFVDLLDIEINDHLVGQLSKLVMMLPGVGTDVKEMMKSKIEEVITQQVSSRLRDYEAIRCVIRAAVDDAGQLLLSDMDSDVDEGDIDGDMPFRNSNRRMMGIQDLDDIEGEDDNEFTDSYRTTDIDESQIPAVVEVAMDAVLSYMSEIIIPALIIHDTTGAIQSVHQIGQHKAPHHTNIDYNGSGDVDFDVSQSLSNGIESVGDNDDEEGDPNRRTLDEDLWGQVIESKDWDSSGHLFEDFEEEAERYRDENSDQELTSGNKVEHEENEDDKNPYVVGIQEDVDEEDEALGSSKGYRHDIPAMTNGRSTLGYFHRFRIQAASLAHIPQQPAELDRDDQTVARFRARLCSRTNANAID